jgi:hypothetical protein
MREFAVGHKNVTATVTYAGQVSKADVQDRLSFFTFRFAVISSMLSVHMCCP